MHSERAVCTMRAVLSNWSCYTLFGGSLLDSVVGTIFNISSSIYAEGRP
jgi:hypothetical protein